MGGGMATADYCNKWDAVYHGYGNWENYFFPVSGISKRYPCPRSVFKYLGEEGSGSSICRSQEICTSRVRVSPV
jgi:hypothetical protein